MAIDIIKMVAITSVIALHYISYHSIPETSLFSYVFIHLAYWLFFQCIGLFCMATGYLCCNKKPTKQYFIKIIPIIFIYFIYCAITALINHPIDSLPSFFSATNYYFFNFAGYFWYMNLYIPFYFLIPYINIAIDKMDKSRLLTLIIISIAIISVPSFITTLRDFFPSLSIYISLPNYFPQDLFPFIYYLIGAYVKINRHQSQTSRIKRFIVVISLIAVLVIHSILDRVYLNIYSSNLEPGQHVFTFGTYGNIYTIISCWLFFWFITDIINIETRNPIVVYISSHTLEIYLGLMIADTCLRGYNFSYSFLGFATWLISEFTISTVFSLAIEFSKRILRIVISALRDKKRIKSNDNTSCTGG